jgi:hypothetical protein
MWVVTERDAAAVYARASLSWYGRKRAKSVAHSMVRKLSKQGDLKGVKTWRLVSEELLRLEEERVRQPLQSNNRAQAWTPVHQAGAYWARNSCECLRE